MWPNKILQLPAKPPSSIYKVKLSTKQRQEDKEFSISHHIFNVFLRYYISIKSLWTYKLWKKITFHVGIIDYNYYEELPDGVEGVLGHDGGLDAPCVQISCAHNLTRSSVRQKKTMTKKLDAQMYTYKLNYMNSIAASEVSYNNAGVKSTYQIFCSNLHN